MSPVPELSVIIPTYNRSNEVELVLDALMRQETDGITYEVIVVDNKGCDATRAVVERAVARGTPVPLRYAHEPRKGVSFARNTGVSLARAPLIAFLDDDGVPVPTWVQEIRHAFEEHPEIDCIGGRVRPVWNTRPPSWLTPAHSGPIAIQDRSRPAPFDREHAWGCMLSANLACRREAFDEVGGFSPDYPRAQDREFELRLWRAGKHGLYLPIADVVVDVPPERLTKAYHRRWHSVVAHYHAKMRYHDTLDSSGRLIPDGTYRTFVDVPLFMYRECLRHLVAWVRAAVTGNGDARFQEELRVRYYFSFFRTRWATTLAPESPRAKQSPRLTVD